MAEYGYSDLDVQYSPRFWVSRMPENTVVETHIRITSAESERVRREVPFRTLRYGPGPREELDEFGGDSLPHDAPIFVYIHGGYWQHLNKDISCYPTIPLFKAGIRVIIVGYDLAPSVKMGTIAEEIQRAASFVLSMAESLGSSGVWFSGFSAGGHLTGVLLCSNWMNSLNYSQVKLIRGFLPISGIFDLQPITKTYINDPLQMDEEEAKMYSPMDMVVCAKHNISVMVIFGQHDSPEFHRQSQEFTQKLKNSHINAVWYEMPGMDHFNLVEELGKSEYILTKKIIELIKSKPDGSTNEKNEIK